MRIRKLSRERIEAIRKRFVELSTWAWENRKADVVEDGILDLESYEKSSQRILWVLKQDFYDSGALEMPYAQRLRRVLDDVNGVLSPSWRRMAQASYGLIHNCLDFAQLPDARTCGEALLQTAVIEVDKELGDSRSPDSVILEGFRTYWDFTKEQIQAYEPDVIIVGMTGQNECLRVVPDEIFHLFRPGEEYRTSGNLCECTSIGERRLLWACHPGVTSSDGYGVSDKAYFEAIVNHFRD